MVNELRDAGHGADWFNYDGAYVTRARHILASLFLGPADGEFAPVLNVLGVGEVQGSEARLC